MKEQVIFTDRYRATGRDYPDPKTVCTGACEGMGCFPLFNPAADIPDRNCRPVDREPLSPELLALWTTAHEHQGSEGAHLCDGYHFVKCPDCGGTGKRPAVNGSAP